MLNNECLHISWVCTKFLGENNRVQIFLLCHHHSRQVFWGFFFWSVILWRSCIKRMNYNSMIKLINLLSGVCSYRVITLQSEWEQAECVFALINVGCVCVCVCVWSLMSVYPVIIVKPSVHLPVCVCVCVCVCVYVFTPSVIYRNKLILSTKQLCYLIPSSPCIILKHTRTHTCCFQLVTWHHPLTTRPPTRRHRHTHRASLTLWPAGLWTLWRNDEPTEESTPLLHVTNVCFSFSYKMGSFTEPFSGRSKVS